MSLSHPRHAPASICLLLMAGALLMLLPGRSSAQSAVILQYHHVSSSTPPVSSISPEDFRRHMAYLRDNDFNILPLEEVLERLQAGESLPAKSAVITFDDGYRSVYDEAFPILKENDWPFTLFISAGLVDGNSRLYASWDQLREMGEHGATLANHTMTHPYFLDRAPGQHRSEWLSGIRAEIEAAETLIEDETGQSHRLLAYPYGEYNPEIQSLLEEMNFIGLGQHSGPVSKSSDFTALPRFPFGGIYAGMNSFRVKVNSLAFDIREAQPRSPVTDEASPSAFIRFGEGDYNLEQLGCFNNDQPIEVSAEDGGYRISTHIENSSRRFRYNCTAPGPGDRYYWYSIDWVNPDIPE